MHGAHATAAWQVYATEGAGDVRQWRTIADCSLVMGSSFTTCHASAPISLRAMGAKGVLSSTFTEHTSVPQPILPDVMLVADVKLCCLASAYAACLLL